MTGKLIGRLLVLALLAMSLKGCIAAATVAGAAAGSLAVHANIRNQNMDLALQGDPTAQYKVGSTYCCVGPGYSTQKATDWLCKSARQEHGPAYFELGRIYIGETNRIYHPGLHISAEVLSKKNLPLSLMWFRLAEDAGVKKASRKINAMRWNYRNAPVLFDRALAEADRMKTNWQAQPCTYDAVFT